MSRARATVSSTRAPSVALVTNVLAHYRVAGFRELAGLLPERIGFFVLARDMGHRRYVLAPEEASLPLTYLEGWRWRRRVADDLHWNRLGPVLRGGHDVVILGGWAEPTYLLLWLRCLAGRRKVLFWVESTAHEAGRTAAREAVKRLLLRHAAGCIVPGRRAREYCASLGMDRERIFEAPNAVDRAFFRERAEKLRPRREELRRELDLSRPTVLFAGRLVERYKGLTTLIDAVAGLEAKGAGVSVLLAGDGPDRERYRERAARLGCRDVRFLGVQDHQALTRLYAAADLLVLPSRSETWGFVLNEGMEFGLPVVVSEAVGAGPDLVRHGENGLIVPVADAAALEDALRTLVLDPAARASMGAASRRIIERFSPRTWAEGVARAVEAVAAVPRAGR